MPDFKLELIVRVASKEDAALVLSTISVILSADPPIAEVPCKVLDIRMAEQSE